MCRVACIGLPKLHGCCGGFARQAFTRIATRIYDDIQEGKYDLSGDSQGIRLGPSSGKAKSSSKSGDGGGGCCR